MGAEKLLGVVKRRHPRMRDSGVCLSVWVFRPEREKGGRVGVGYCIGLDRSLEPALGGRKENDTVLSQPPP